METLIIEISVFDLNTGKKYEYINSDFQKARFELSAAEHDIEYRANERASRIPDDEDDYRDDAEAREANERAAIDSKILEE